MSARIEIRIKARLGLRIRTSNVKEVELEVVCIIQLILLYARTAELCYRIRKFYFIVIRIKFRPPFRPSNISRAGNIILLWFVEISQMENTWLFYLSANVIFQIIILPILVLVVNALSRAEGKTQPVTPPKIMKASLKSWLITFATASP